MVGTKIIFIAEKCPTGTDYNGTQQPPPCGISTYKITQSGKTVSLTGVQSFSRLAISQNGVTTWYETLNTPTVDSTNSRVYIVASALCYGCGLTDARQGQLFVADVNKNDGAISNIAPILSFPGPSGASPVLIPNMPVVVGSSLTGNGIFL